MSNKIASRQKTLFSLLVALLLALCVLLFYLLDSKKEPESVPAKIDLPSDGIDPQELWMQKMEEREGLLEAKMRLFEEALKKASLKEEGLLAENGGLKSRIESLKIELEQVKRASKEKRPKRSKEPLFSSGGLPPPIRKPLLKEAIAAPPERRKSHVSQAIPSGTTVKAVLLSSVDIPCSISSSSDPQPVKLRILDDGHLPKCVEAPLKDGIVIAGVYGDLSNERAYMRLERLTQVKSDGSFVETAIAGFVSGEDGKYGVRGVVVDTAQKVVSNAAVSGLFSGINSYFQALAASEGDDCCSYRDHCFGLAKEGVFCGASNAFEKLTEYYIKKAESINPVIQVAAGRRVDITFTHGAELGGESAQAEVRKTREESRRRPSCGY